MKTPKAPLPQVSASQCHSLLYASVRDRRANRHSDSKSEAASSPHPHRCNLLDSAHAQNQPGKTEKSDHPTLTLSSPLEYQVFQRSTCRHGAIIVRGGAPTAIRVAARVEGISTQGRLSGKWHLLALDPANQQFSGQLSVIDGGFYRVEIKATNAVGQPTFVVVQQFGVGEVFAIAGQSNSTNYGEVPQATHTAMVTSFSGTEWFLANDPQPGVQDNSRKGSFVPSFGDATTQA